VESKSKTPGPTIQDVEPPRAELAADYEVALVSLNQWQLAWRRFRRHKLAMVGTGLFLTMCAMAIFGPFLLPYEPLPPAPQPCPGLSFMDSYRGCPPGTAGHLLGTTGSLQRDVLTLVVNGARLSLLIGVGASVFAAIIGAIVGGIAGYFGGLVDNLLMRIVDVLLSLPILFVILLLAKVFGHGNWLPILVVFAALGWMGIARLVRSLFLSLRTEAFVDAARVVGVSDIRIIFRHILPNAMSPVIVATTLSVAGVIIGEAFVSYLGFGVDMLYQPTWGNVLSNAQNFLTQGNWWWPLFPGLAIVLTVLGINFMGDGLRDALDPRSRE
jgi:peptide/nickel transport system permease protein